METTQNNENKFRLNFKQTAKGDFYGEWTVKADTIEELKSNEIAIEQLFKERLLGLKNDNINN